MKRGTITYDDRQGHVCSCAERWRSVLRYEAEPQYDRTVEVDRSIEPTEGGSYWYACSRCGAGAWSGC